MGFIKSVYHDHILILLPYFKLCVREMGVFITFIKFLLASIKTLIYGAYQRLKHTTTTTEKRP